MSAVTKSLPEKISAPLPKMTVKVFLPEEAPKYFTRRPGPNFSKRSKVYGRLQGLTLRGPTSDTETAKHSSHGNAADNKSTDTVTNDAKLRTSINTGSMVANKNKQTNAQYEGTHDVRFFSELVKPLQYKMHSSFKDREKVITPSKYGYHPRSKSPTFKRLCLATEKLQLILDEEINESLKNKIEEQTSKVKSAQSEPNKVKSAQSDSNKVKVTNYSTETKCDPSELEDTDSQRKDNDWNYWESPEDSETSDVEEGDKDSFLGLFRRKHFDRDAKVDFKVAETHAELHLFLPHINGNENQNDRIGMTSANSNGGESESSGRLYLPSIGNQSRTPERTDVSPVRRFNRYNVNTARKKKRGGTRGVIIQARCPSAYDPEKRVHDHLNDVNTLISIENERDHPRDSLCSFENCLYHTKVANTNN